MKNVLCLFVLTCFLSAAFAAPDSPWQRSHWILKDEINEIAAGDLDLCNVFAREASGVLFLKITTRAPLTAQSAISLSIADKAGIRADLNSARQTAAARWDSYRGVWEIEFTTPAEWSGLEYLELRTYRTNSLEEGDSGRVQISTRRSLDGQQGNCAFVHHGNQGLTYTDVFRGTGGSPDNGFDEILELHQARNVPGNFHLSGTLITAADWYDRPFLDWMNTGIAEGWVAMLTSVYAQHIMPFVYDDMNNWAVNTEYDLIQYKFGYDARVAWIPERVWLSAGHYPDAGLNDSWLGDNWTQHGIDAVILDDWPHASGQSSTKIHWMDNESGITLRVIPINGSFTGNCHYNPGAAIAQIDGTDQYNIIVYGTDWEAAAELADFGCVDCLENYSQVVNWAADNFPAVEIWKLDNALDNPDFNGATFDLGTGTYGLIGGDQGYGGSNNSWYTDWAGTASLSDNHSPTPWDYGTVWTQVYNNVISAPANTLSETAWYVMMTNLHETGWHDYMGGPISGWQHRYSSHIKNAAVYAEAASWANGDYELDVNAYFSDIDIDGVDELIIHNDRVFAVFESIGGRAQYIFSKGPGAEIFSIVGSCNTYWNETDGDYDEPSSNNHQAAFSDVGPHYRNELYGMSVVNVTGTTASIQLTYNEITKIIELGMGNPYLLANYDIGPQDGYIRHGMSPDLLGMIWDADMDRVWDPDEQYMGFRNPNSGATGALVLANGGASHNLEFSGTLLRGDELRGFDRFAYLLYAGPTSAPDGTGRITELEALLSIDLDEFPPRLNSQAAFIDANTAELTFSESVDPATAETTSNYDLQNFIGSYTVTGAERQPDWRKVRLTLSPNLPGGESGEIVVSNVMDLNSNLIDPAFNTAVLSVPSGYTPHTIIIDGTQDFDTENECLFTDGDTLTITWDAANLYIGFWNQDLASADIFVNIDTDQTAGSGAATGSWSRVDFANPFRIEYQIAIDGGPSNMQINNWTGSGWNWVNYGGHGGESYNGWSGNPYTEIKIPWADIGNPSGIALSVHLTQQANSTVTAVFPPSNPTGSGVTISSVYRIYQPFASGPLPLMGVRTKNILSETPTAPADLVITYNAGQPHLSWTAVPQAHTYSVYRSDNSDGPYQWLGDTSGSEFDDASPAGDKVFYEVIAVGGI